MNIVLLNIIFLFILVADCRFVIALCEFDIFLQQTGNKTKMKSKIEYIIHRIFDINTHTCITIH